MFHVPGKAAFLFLRELSLGMKIPQSEIWTVLLQSVEFVGTFE